MTDVNSISKSRIFGNAQLFVSGIATGMLAWDVADWCRDQWLEQQPLTLSRWVRTYYYPDDSALVSYLFAAFAVGLYALVSYLRFSEERRGKAVDLQSSRYLTAVLALSSVALLAWPALKPSVRMAVAVIVALAPLWGGPVYQLCKKSRIPTIALLTWAILCLLFLEPFRVMTGPVYLMGEYPDLYSQTRLSIGLADNDTFLARFEPQALLHRGFTGMDTLIDLDLGYVDSLWLLRRIRHELGGDLPLFELPVNRVSQGTDPRVAIAKLNDVIDFVKYNRLEYDHQNMSRGQINHVGHVLNPLSEYGLGKPVQNVYFQYGVGNTLLMRFIMDLYGGLSYQAYYKVYVLYLLYFALFFVMLKLLLRDSLMVLGALCVAAIGFFMTGYVGFILAPGIIPSIHMLDVLAVIVLFFYLRSKRLILLAAIFILCALAVFINSSFGIFLGVSISLPLMLHRLETVAGRTRWYWITILLMLLVASITIPSLVVQGGAPVVMKYFLVGFFSWPLNPVIPLLAVLYLVLSYAFFFALRKHNFPLKYVYLFVCLYTQMLLVYYFWSGLTNHLPMSIPFLGVQFFLVLYTAKVTWSSLSAGPKRVLDVGTKASVGAALVLVVWAAAMYYQERDRFVDNFKNHEVYMWQFDRAKVISTMNPEPISEAVQLIQKYSDDNAPAICIISKYDNLLPFLTRRYSIMPHFELPYFLLSERELHTCVQRIQSSKPRYLFVDADITRYTQDPASDPWSKLFFARFDRVERESRLGRYAELQKLFRQVSPDYVEIERGALISVMKRKTAG